MLAFYTHATGCFVRDDALPHSPFAGKPFWNHCIGYQAWRGTLFTGAIYLAERLYREIRSRRETQITKVVRHPYSTLPADPCIPDARVLTDAQMRSRSNLRSRP